MTNQVRARMDRGDVFSTVHGERGPDDRHATTHYVQNGLPFDGEGYLILDHADFEAEKGDNCSNKAADLRGKAHALISQAERKEKKRLARQAEEDRRNPPRRGERPRSAVPAPTERRAVPPPPAPAAAPAEPRSDTPEPPESLAGTVQTFQSPANTFDAPEPDLEDEETGLGDDDADIDDPDIDDDEPVKVNMEAVLRGEEDVPWHILTQEIAARFKRRVANMKDAVDFLVADPEGPKVVPVAQLAKKYQKHLD